MLVTPSTDPIAKIKVVGIGGAGGNAINTMITDYDIPGVEFLAFNTDAQSLKNSQAQVTLQLGPELTRGLGVGGQHTQGAAAAEEVIDEISEHLQGADMVFLTAGMGGGTGTGATPVVAGIAKNLGALTVAVVTTPFKFEGSHRQKIAEEGLAALQDKVDALIVIPNQGLLELVDESISFVDAMKKVDSVLAEGVQSIASLITQTGNINADFNDLKAIMTNAGTALMGMGRASGPNRAEEAARMAASSPLLGMSIEGATGVLFNVVGGIDLSMKEIEMASNLIHEAVDPSANIIWGTKMDPEIKDELRLTIVATGFDASKQKYKTQSSQGTQPVEQKPASKSGMLKSEPDSSKVIEDSGFVDTVSKINMGNIGNSQKVSSLNFTDDDESDDLDVPAFMRRPK